MDNPTDKIIVISNLPDQGSATRLAEILISRGQAACVNVLAPCTSIYHWQDKTESAQEVPVLIKTTQENVRAQLDHLRTHPSVALQLRKGKVDLHGWVYSISTGDIWVYDFDSEEFTSLLDEPPRLKAAP